MGNPVCNAEKTSADAFPMAALPTIAPKSPIPAAQVEDAGFSWTVRVSRRRPGLTAKIGVIVFSVFVCGLCFYHSLWMAGLPTLALLFSLSEFVFPAHYTLTPQSASARYGLTSLQIAWKDVRHAYLAEDGIKLSPLRAKNSRFEPLRGVFLRFDDGNRDAVIAAVKRLRQEAAASA